MVELLIAMGILSVFITLASAAVEQIMNATTGITQRAQAADQLQSAEETVVRDVHAASAFCAGQSFTAPETTLEFTASINGSTPSFEIQITNNELTLAENTSGACSWTTSSILVTGLDPATSGAHGSYFTIVPSTAWTGGGPTTSYQFYIGVDLTLTVDSARRTRGTQSIQTTVSDDVEVWNQEYACQSAWTNNPPTSGGATDPC